MKIAVIGAGSTYTPELINGFIERIASLPLTELALMDINPQRLEIVGGFARRMVAAKGAPFTVTLTTDQRAAVKDARYVITQLRVGGLQARREDEYLGRRHGLVGQETTGIGGMGKALRTIPVILQVARDMAELAPEGVLVNFTNPSGLVTEALSRHAPQVSAVGVCNGPFGQKMGALNFLKQRGRFDGNPDEADADILGLNHLSWFRGLSYHDVDLWDEYLDLLNRDTRVNSIAERAWMIDEWLVRPGIDGQPRILRIAELGNNKGDPTTHQMGKVALHGHCYQKARPPVPDGYPVGAGATRSMLEALGYQVDLIETGCCGTGGRYGVRERCRD